MKELIKITEQLKGYQKYDDVIGTSHAIQYDLSYYQDALSDMLKDMDSSYNNYDIDNITNLITMNHYKIIIEEIALFLINQNVKKINTILTKSHISTEDIIKNSKDMIHAYDSSTSILDNLTYEDCPIEAAQRVIRRLEAILTYDLEKNKFCFIFVNKLSNKNIQSPFYCNTLYEFFDYHAHFMLSYINDETKKYIVDSNKTIPTIPAQEIDRNKISQLKNQELYIYATSIDYIKVNYFLEDLYLFLFYKDIEPLYNPIVMRKLKQSLLQNAR